MTHGDLRKLYKVNNTIIENEIASRISDANLPAVAPHEIPEGHEWGDASLRTELHLIYLISFWCLLRYDETLNIQCHWLELIVDESGKLKLKLTLPIRKQSQLGGEWLAVHFSYMIN